MSAAAPWSVKGIDPKAREIAKDLARRSGMTLGEWLNSMIMEDGEDDDVFTPLARRPHAAEAFDRRGRSRRLDDAYGSGDETLQRVAASVEVIADRLEAAERRSTVAITGVDQAVSGLVRRLDGSDVQTKTHAKRIDDIAEELREGHRRLRRFEQETGPKVAEEFGRVEGAIGKVEGSVGAVAGRLYDIEERQRSGVNELRQRMDAVEKAAANIPGPGVGAEVLSQVGARLDAAQGRTSDALRRLEQSFAGLDQRLRAAEGRIEPEGAREAARFEKLAEMLARQVDASRSEMMRRLDTAEADGRLDRVERALQAMGEQVKAAEQRSAQGIESMGREVLRIAQNLNGRMERAEAAGVERVERLGQTVAQNHAQAQAATQALGQSLAQSLGQTISQQIDRDMGRYAQAVEQRLIAADDRHALAIEKLGGEITRISDRLSDRIAQSERKSAQALEDIGRRLSESSDRIEQRYDRASGELAERMRLSEERTVRLLAEARETMEHRAAAPVRAEPIPDPVAPAQPPADFAQPDWRAAAFGAAADEPEAAADLWAEPAPFPDPFAAGPSAFAEERPVETPVFRAAEPAPEPSPQPFASQSFTAQAFSSTAVPAPVTAASPFGSFGGADVEDALDATQSGAGQPFGHAPAGHAFDAGDHDFAGETDFVDPQALRAAAAAGRAASTRTTIDAARAAMASPMAAEEAPAPKGGFGLGRKGGKSRLQERLDQQANRDGSTVRKALLASVTAVAVTAGVYGYARLTDGEGMLPGGGGDLADATPIAALALTPADATPAEGGDAATLYAQGTQQLDGGDAEGLKTIRRAAELGYAPAQLHLAGLYQTGDQGVTADTAESRLWARRAAESGDARGMHAYGMYLFDGVGGARNRAEALDWLKRAADKGLVDSQYNVARLFENGDEGIARNPAEALKWYAIAARAGDQQAQAAFTRLTPKSTSEARQAARRAADAFQAKAAG